MAHLAAGSGVPGGGGAGGGPEPLWVVAPDGVRLACWDLTCWDLNCASRGEEPGAGHRRRPVLFTHGSGLNGHCWAPVGELLGWRGLWPLALDLRGHGASGRSPGANYDWGLFAGDVLAAVDQLGLGPRGVLGAGHSAGASALLLAEARCRGTFAALWLWEPIMALPGSDLRHPRSQELAGRARRRRSHFASLDQARSHWAGRGMFQEFDPAAFEGFLSGALVPAVERAGTANQGAANQGAANQGAANQVAAGERAAGERAARSEAGYVLACDPEDEARTFEASASHDAWGLLGEVRCPVRVLGGSLSPAVPPADVEAIAERLPAGEAVTMTGLGHFGPFQRPAEVAGDISTWAVHLGVAPGG